MTRDPWAVVTGAIEPPPWQGPTTVHRMPDDEEPKREPVGKEAPDPSLIARRTAVDSQTNPPADGGGG